MKTTLSVLAIVLGAAFTFEAPAGASWPLLGALGVALGGIGRRRRNAAG